MSGGLFSLDTAEVTAGEEALLPFDTATAEAPAVESQEESFSSTSPFVYLVAAIALYLVIRLKWLTNTPKVREH